VTGIEAELGEHAPPTLPARSEKPPAEDVILGVDTHKDVHVAAVVTVLGVLLAHQEFPVTAAGYRQLVAWARSFGALRRAGVECAGSHGAALARFLSRENIHVVEVNQPDRALRRKHGKTDAVDAEAAARAVLSGRADVTPKTGHGPAADMRLLRLAKESAVKARTQAKNQLKAVLLGIDPELREALSDLSDTALIATCADLPDAGDAAAFTLRLLARRIQQLTAEVKELACRVTKTVRRCRPELLDIIGVGPDSAAALLIAVGDNPERLASEASFAALCGVSPVEQSKDRRLREFINTHDWITCYFLPSYAPDLNPVEGIWSLLGRSSQANTAFTDPDHLISALRQGLRQIQYRSNLIDGCLAETGLTLTTSRQQRQ